MADHLEDIELRSSEVQEILSRPPSTLVRWGITVFFIIILLLFIGGCLFRYPDVVQAEIVITTEHPPVWMVARTTGKLKEIFLQDRHSIKTGEVIAAMENPALTTDMFILKEKLKNFTSTDSCVCNISFPEKMALGTVQPAYNAFMKALSAYRDFLKLDLYTQKEEAICKEIKEYRVYIAHLHKQVGYSEEEMKITESTYNREKKLYQQNVISDAALEDAHRSYLSYKHTAEQLMLTLSSARIREANLEQNIIELKMEHSREANTLLTSLNSAFNELVATINNWEQTYLFTAPADGILSYQHVWQENQEIAMGEKIFSIVAAQAGKIIGKAMLPTSGFGKVKTGQRVNIQLTGYPYMEFGYLTGTILSVSMLADKENYIATISLPQSLTTSYNKNLTFNGELTGIAEIMTDERSFTSRLFAPLKYLWEKHF
ncbi:HlyD family secretion protein [Bacteroides sp. 519]|uniref:HlyD family secretion protein n=1 Tax=Bacteroides sp. 519 TaxID=2302937 RepID=UPI0013D5BC3A|nr:HlyD family secretion protein [Bacteroides sp. 519]NDV57502.1 HlyD family secretion protein [Bacteroides sp. 519]